MLLNVDSFLTCRYRAQPNSGAIIGKERMKVGWVLVCYRGQETPCDSSSLGFCDGLRGLRAACSMQEQHQQPRTTIWIHIFSRTKAFRPSRTVKRKPLPVSLRELHATINLHRPDQIRRSRKGGGFCLEEEFNFFCHGIPERYYKIW